MKMKKSLVALCLSVGLAAYLPAASFADANFVPQNTSAAPSIPVSALHQLIWTPVDQSKTQTTKFAIAGQKLNVPGISGPVAAYSVPANIGELKIMLTSEVDNKNRVFSPNVLIFDQNMTPYAFFPGTYFTYLVPGVMSSDRLQGVMRLTPAPGQQKIYVLVFTTPRDLQQNTKLINPAKAYAKGTGNAVPDIPDPIAKHISDGTISLRVKSASGASILVGSLFGSSRPVPVIIGNTAASVSKAHNSAPFVQRGPILDDTENYFNDGIRLSVEKGDIDKALKLMNEAERIGSKSARSVFIESVKGK
ncbi:maltose operon protein [Izhakiella capsodis]|uniref:Maltose operon protein n=1 Tax=Izhakiella capsodis TaxID=1367852 RepID=A0A1I4Z1T9_9GAMM|nr:maltose operon protein MalM [Izhakiella capsodis]SFN44023.1 maltose operon protein [Izhakiella capsodis]